MANYCSGYCKNYDHCLKLGILDYMIVLPKHPSELNKNWCESFEENIKE
jgi:hypothetical protein